MTAIILAAGCARRFGNYLQGRSKCLLQVDGKSLLEHQVALYRANGIDDILVVLGHGADQIRAEGVRFAYNPDYEATNMVHSLFCAAPYIGTEVVVSYADILFSSQTLQTVLGEPSAHIGVAVDIEWQRSASVRFSDPRLHVEGLTYNENRELGEIGAPAPAWDSVMGQYIGLMRIDRVGWKHFVALDAEAKSGQEDSAWCRGRTYKMAYMTDFLQRLIDSGVLVHAILIHGGWVEFDCPEDYERFVELGRTGRLASLGL